MQVSQWCSGQPLCTQGQLTKHSDQVCARQQKFQSRKPKHLVSYFHLSYTQFHFLWSFSLPATSAAWKLESSCFTSRVVRMVHWNFCESWGSLVSAEDETLICSRWNNQESPPWIISVCLFVDPFFVPGWLCSWACTTFSLPNKSMEKESCWSEAESHAVGGAGPPRAVFMHDQPPVLWGMAPAACSATGT